MPDKHTNKLIISLLLGLFVFLDPSFVAICYYLFRFTAIKKYSKTVFQIKSTTQKSKRQKNHHHFLQKIKKVRLDFPVLPKNSLKRISGSQKQVKYTLQIGTNLKKQGQHILKALKIRCNLHKSRIKQVKASKIYPCYLQNRISTAFFLAFSYVNTAFSHSNSWQL